MSDIAKRVGGFDLIYDGVVVEENLCLFGVLNDDRELFLVWM